MKMRPTKTRVAEKDWRVAPSRGLKGCEVELEAALREMRRLGENYKHGNMIFEKNCRIPHLSPHRQHRLYPQGHWREPGISYRFRLTSHTMTF